MDFLDDLVPIVAILSCVALPIGFGMYLGLMNIRTKNKENMELIKQGIVPPSAKSTVPNKYRSLRNGFLCIGIGIGLIIGMSIIHNVDMNSQDEIFILAAPILIFLGISYVLFYWITKDKNLEDE
ncbi:MAG: DUF6249 domain-containing protein [Dysgonomonas sp.]|nr:DUF6249 domain-containing protein [Dysgonomonas sp.]